MRKIMNKNELTELAIKAMNNAYSPYSGVKVGAALLCSDGSVYTGCNIENASYSATNCAERTAIFKAVSEGKRDFSAIAICGGRSIEGEECAPTAEQFPPCGVCRQVMREFCRDDFEIILVTSDKAYSYTLSELLPVSFGPDHLTGDISK